MPEDITITVLREKDVSQEIKGHFSSWTQHIFGDEEDKYEWAALDWRVLVACDGEWVNHIAITERTISIAGEPYKAAGIGGVMTPETWRGKGMAAAGLARADALIRDRLQVDFGVLLCAPDVEPVYAKLGWERIQSPVFFAQSAGPVQWEESAMYLNCSVKKWPKGVVDLQGLPW